MYPQINLAGGFTNPTPVNTTAPAGGPGLLAPGSPTDPSTSLLRVVVGEMFRVAPPVPAPPSASGALPGATSTSTATTGGASNLPLNFEYEKQVLKDLEAPRNVDSIGNNDLRKEERCEALISQCCSSGFTREEAVLALSVALAIAGPRADGSTVAQAAGNIRHMTGMGFLKSDAVGALVAKNGNLQAAMDMF